MAKIINRSKGVIILATLLLIAHLPFDSEASTYYEQYFGNLSRLFQLVDLVSNIAGMIIAIGLLFFKDPIRKAVIILHAIYIPDAIMRFLISFPNIAKNFFGADISKHHFITIFASVFTIGICILYIYFFNRPKVKEQFK